MHHSAIHATHLAHAIERGGDGVMGGSSACNTGEHWQEVDAADHGRDGDDERSISNPPMWKAMMLLATFCASLIFWGGCYCSTDRSVWAMADGSVVLADGKSLCRVPGSGWPVTVSIETQKKH